MVVDAAPHGHRIQFYEDHSFLVRRVASHLGDALAAGGTAIVIARPETRAGVERALEVNGFAIAALAADGRLISRDADETLATFLVDGLPDAEQFRARVVAVIERAREARPDRPIHAFGEMVDILWADHREAAVLALETLWTQACRKTKVALLCGYRLAGFAHAVDAFEAVCASHEPLEAFVELEQRTLALEHEVARRTHVERRMQQLLELTGELAAAGTRDEVVALALDKGMKAVGAAAIALWLRDGDHLDMLATSSRFREVRPEFRRIRLGADMPLTVAVRDGEPVFLGSPEDYAARFPASYERVREALPFPEFAFALVPMTASATLGGIAFTYDRRREFEPTDRAFKAIVARQCAIALERIAALDHERTQREESELLYQLTAEVNRVDSIDEVYELALAAVERGTSSQRAAILLLDGAGKMRFRSHHRLSDTYRAAVDGHSPWSAETKDPQPIAVDDTEVDPAWAAYRDVFRAEGIRALAFVPLVHHGKLIGTFMLYRDRPQAFGARELQFASTVAVHVAHAVERATSEHALARAFSEERAAHLEAEESTRAREEILSVVSHDLRNPLGTIMIGASTLLQVEVTDRQRVRSVAGRIHRQAEHMARLIDDLVDFAAIRSGRIALARGVHSPAKILDATSDMFGAIAKEHGVAFEAVAPSDLPNVDCDSERAVQVFSNLVANAIKVTPRGGAVAIGAEPADSQVVFFVRDTGPGIEADDVPMLFERFWRGKSSPYKGAGLGLSIARGIVDAHGGRIWAESEVGKGSTFYFSLST